MTTQIQPLDVTLAPARRQVIAWRRVAPLVALLDVAGILAAAATGSSIYYFFAYSEAQDRGGDFNFQLTVALLYVLVRALRGDYSYMAYTASHRNIGRIFQAWTLAFLTVLGAVFLLKVGHYYSRGMAFSLFLIGPFELLMQQRILAHWLVAASRAGRLAVRRVFVVGNDQDVDDICAAARSGRSGHAVVGTFFLGDGSDPDAENRLLQQAVARVRSLSPCLLYTSDAADE